MESHVIGESLERCFVSGSVDADNTEPANLVDVVQRIADAAKATANAITPLGAMKGTDAAGGCVGSLTEAVMGMTAGLFQIAAAIESLAESVRDK